jgi:hypothetical protein
MRPTKIEAFKLGIQYIIDVVEGETGKSLSEKLSELASSGESIISEISDSSIHTKYGIEEKDMIGFYIGLGTVLGEIASYQDNTQRTQFFSSLVNVNTKDIVISRLYEEMINDISRMSVTAQAYMGINTLH